MDLENRASRLASGVMASIIEPNRRIGSQPVVDVPLIDPLDDVVVTMTIHTEHRIQMAVDCECGTTIGACDEEELFDELLEHIAAAHETVLQREPEALLSGIHDGRP